MKPRLSISAQNFNVARFGSFRRGRTSSSTLIRGLPSPPIYLREAQADGLSRIVREVIDGQQRVRVVLDFLDGEFSLSPKLWTHLKQVKPLTTSGTV